jgi:hypothetical protein
LGKGGIGGKEMNKTVNRRLSLLLLGILALTIIATSLNVRPASAIWWNNEWTCRKKITINHSLVVADLTNFPVLIDVTDSDLANKAQDDGDDIAFADENGNKLNHEIESFNGTSGKLTAWICIPFLSSTTDTVLYMYYGNPNAENQQNPAGVWISDYRMVQHLNEASGTHYDSTAYGNNGTYYGTQQNAEGKIDGADGFRGNLGANGGDYIDCGNDTSLNINQAITVSAWIKPNDQTQWNHICTKGNGEWDVDANRVYQLSIQPNETIDFIINSNRDKKAITSITVPIGQWSYVVGTYDRNYIIIYINGVERARSAFTEPIQNNSVNLRIASRVKGTGNTGPPAYTFDGLIDEVRIAATARSQAWLQTEYNNQNDPSSFYTFGIEETLSATVFVNPSSIVVYVGQEFSIDVDLSFARNLYGFQFYLSFNNSVLNATSIVYKGYLNEPTLEWPTGINNEQGYVYMARTSRYPATGKTGGSPPPLATIYFKCIGEGVSQLHLYDTILSDDQSIPISLQTIDGQVICLAVNRPPTIDSYYPEADPVILERHSQEFNITYSDPDGDPVSVQWYLDSEPTATSDSYTFVAGIGSAGIYNVTVVVSDGLAQASHEWKLTVLRLITIDEVTPCDMYGNPKDSFKIGTLANFKVKVNNIGSEPVNVLITVNIYDSAGITIGVASFQGPISPGVSTIILGLPVPSTANLGQATVFAGVFTDWLHMGGIPYCPEVSSTFEITA